MSEKVKECGQTIVVLSVVVALVYMIIGFTFLDVTQGVFCVMNNRK
ncbi:MAG: hypothetical protein ACRCTE_05505 [Cellulosilyticaceae bacterium]